MDHYKKILEEIDQIKKNCNRSDPVNLVAVTKNRHLNDLHSLQTQGCLDFGENRVQEALLKSEEMPKKIRWHLIGSLQKNKVKTALPLIHLIHSVDSFELAKKISETASELGLKANILLQVNVSKETSKKGFLVEEFWQNLEKILILQSIDVKGLMTMAPQQGDEKTIRFCFSTLREIKEKINRDFCPTQPFKILSMGMSNDYRLAIEEGSTLLRIGRALFQDHL